MKNKRSQLAALSALLLLVFTSCLITTEPDVELNFVGEPAATTVTLKWEPFEASDYASPYSVYCYLGEEAVSSKLFLGPDESSYVFTGLTPETEYSFKLIAKRYFSDSNYFEKTIKVSTTKYILQAPVLKNEKNAVKAEVSGIIPDLVSELRLLRADSIDGLYEEVDSAFIWSGDTDAVFTDKNVKDQTTYFYKVNGFKDDKVVYESEISEITCNFSLPLMIENIQFTPDIFGGELTWNPDPKAKKYIVRIYDKYGYSVKYKRETTETKFYVLGLEPGSEFKISVTGATSEGDEGQTSELILYKADYFPIEFEKEEDWNSVTLKFKKPESKHNYEVSYKAELSSYSSAKEKIVADSNNVITLSDFSPCEIKSYYIYAELTYIDFTGSETYCTKKKYESLTAKTYPLPKDVTLKVGYKSAEMSFTPLTSEETNNTKVKYYFSAKNTEDAESSLINSEKVTSGKITLNKLEPGVTYDFKFYVCPETYYYSTEVVQEFQATTKKLSPVEFTVSKGTDSSKQVSVNITPSAEDTGDGTFKYKVLFRILKSSASKEKKDSNDILEFTKSELSSPLTFNVNGGNRYLVSVKTLITTESGVEITTDEKSIKLDPVSIDQSVKNLALVYTDETLGTVNEIVDITNPKLWVDNSGKNVSIRSTSSTFIPGIIDLWTIHALPELKAGQTNYCGVILSMGLDSEALDSVNTPRVLFADRMSVLSVESIEGSDKYFQISKIGYVDPDGKITEASVNRPFFNSEGKATFTTVTSLGLTADEKYIYNNTVYFIFTTAYVSTFNSDETKIMLSYYY